MARKTKRVLTDEQWQRIAPYFPRHLPSPQGGRPRADDRECLEADGYEPVIPHRANRVRPSRNDGRRLRRYRRRWLVERTNAWIHCYRGLAVRWSYYSFMYA